MSADAPMPKFGEEPEETVMRAPHPNACPQCGQVSPVEEHVRTGFCPFCMAHTNPKAPEAPTEPEGAQIVEEIERDNG